jgi:hypothetical protein
MIFLPVQSVSALRISVTATATSLFSLMDTAGSINTSQKYYSDLGANAIIITPENGDVRWLVGGTPTTTTGTKISQGATLPFAGIDLSLLKLISVSGTVICTVQLYKSEPGEGLSLGGGGGGVGGLAPSGSTAVGNPVQVGGVYNSAYPTLTNGQAGSLQMDSSANTLVSLATQIAGENLNTDVLKVSQEGNFTRITTATTTVCKSGAGAVIGIRVEVATTGIVTVYDNTAASGTIVGIYPLGLPVGWHEILATVNTGVTVVTAAADRIVVITK